MDTLKARNLVSDWLNQTCCKGMRNQEEPSVILLLSDLKAAHQIILCSDACDMTRTRGYAVKLFEALHDARGNDLRVRAPHVGRLARCCLNRFTIASFISLARRHRSQFCVRGSEPSQNPCSAVTGYVVDCFQGQSLILVWV